MSTDTQIQQLPTSGQTHHHAHHQMVFGLRGRAEFELEGPGGHEVTPWVGCLVPSEYNHAFQGIGDNQMLIVNIDQTAEAAALVHPELIEPLFEQPRYVELDLDFVRLLRVVGAEMARAPSDPWLGSHLTGSLLHALYHRLYDGRLLNAPQRERLQLNRIDAWLHQHLSESVRVADLAQLCCLSVSQFQEVFREKTGRSPYQYVLKVRLETAAWLLRHSRQPIADIALQVGFANQSALTKAMKAQMGRTPADIRQQARLH
ncbi:AraC family transcriptional regulator [Natronospirillum operosum]|uniref:AraC family transcriptional regulator n=1 Tax=Natronospirillum operosum TaxID=2759953 RepID=A0A4Z0WC43_9GAMM|nr:AraC family transcriptional regulator [Natronospirillum operosum]TGG91323.1 AraC family transcriptional regulator [Natronospirillum operosum]